MATIMKGSFLRVKGKGWQAQPGCHMGTHQKTSAIQGWREQS